MEIEPEATHESNDGALDAGLPQKNPPEVLAKLDALHDKRIHFPFLMPQTFGVLNVQNFRFLGDRKVGTNHL